LDTQHAFTAKEIIWILRQLAQGLSRAHKIGIVHRGLFFMISSSRNGFLY